MHVYWHTHPAPPAPPPAVSPEAPSPGPCRGVWEVLAHPSHCDLPQRHAPGEQPGGVSEVTWAVLMVVPCPGRGPHHCFVQAVHKHDSASLRHGPVWPRLQSVNWPLTLWGRMLQPGVTAIGSLWWNLCALMANSKVCLQRWNSCSCFSCCFPRAIIASFHTRKPHTQPQRWLHQLRTTCSANPFDAWMALRLNTSCLPVAL